jgi:hypothetical protein
MQKILLLCLAFATLILACKKDKPMPIELPKQVYLDIPFEMTSKADCYMLDTFFDSLSNQEITNKVVVSLKSINDLRDNGYVCSVSWGGYAEINVSAKLNDNTAIECINNMPGCTGNNEWDTINTFAPRCAIDIYKLFLLKLEPFTDENINENLPSNLEDYTVKYVFKKP